MSSPSVPSVRTRACVGAVAIGAILAAAALVSPAALLGAVESVAADPVLFGLAVAALYLGRPLLALPTTPLAVVVGYGYGVAVGVPIALVGVVTTVVPVFLVVRWLVGSADAPAVDAADVVDATDADNANAASAATAADATGESASPSVTETLPGPFGSILERAGAVVDRYYETAGPIRGVVASRLAPIPSDVATCAAAMGGVRLRHLVIGTAIGELPWTIAAVVVGASAATVRTDGIGDLGIALTAACLVAAIALLAVPAYRALRTRGVDERPSSRSTDG